jgi:hypothetical protein
MCSGPFFWGADVTTTSATPHSFVLRRLKDFILKNPLHTPRPSLSTRLQSRPHASHTHPGHCPHAQRAPTPLFLGLASRPKNLGILKGSHPLSRRRHPLEPYDTTTSATPHSFLLRRLKDFILKNPLHTPRPSLSTQLQSRPHASPEHCGPLSPRPAGAYTPFLGLASRPKTSGFLRGRTP